MPGTGGGSDVSPIPVAPELKGGVTGVAYSETISAQGGTSRYTFAVTSGALPTSTSLNSATGVISGTPTVAASSSFTVTVTDANGFTGSQGFTITIAAPSSSGGAYEFVGWLWNFWVPPGPPRVYNCAHFLPPLEGK